MKATMMTGASAARVGFGWCCLLLLLAGDDAVCCWVERARDGALGGRGVPSMHGLGWFWRTLFAMLVLLDTTWELIGGLPFT
jgi:hypothetical protein